MDKLSEEALNWSLTHIERFGDTDFFPVPFEFAAIRHTWDMIRSELAGIDLENYFPHSPRRLPVPKPGGGFRVVSQLDPRDALIYSSMVYETALQVEASRVAESSYVACSYRISPTASGSLFAPASGWPEFHTRSQQLAESGEFGAVLVADITDFYNHASQHRIENALELAGVSPDRAKNIELFLSRLSARHSRGLPVGPTASIVLAEACLTDVDMFLVKRRLTHTRYVDDFRVFCDTQATATKTLHDLCDYLYTSHRLSLNFSKTRIVPCDEFLEKECLDPEELERQGHLERLRELIEATAGDYGDVGAGEDLEWIDDDMKAEAIRDNIRDLFAASLHSGRLSLGVVRHLLRRATKLRTNVISDLVMENLALLSPVLRDVAAYLKQTKGATRSRAQQFADFARNDVLGSLPFCRMWCVDIANAIDGLLSEENALEIAETAPLTVAGRCAALVARNKGVVHWVRERKETWSNLGAWERRALVYASSALPRDERNPWLGMVDASRDTLDVAVAQYVRGTAH